MRIVDIHLLAAFMSSSNGGGQTEIPRSFSPVSPGLWLVDITVLFYSSYFTSSRCRTFHVYIGFYSTNSTFNGLDDLCFPLLNKDSLHMFMSSSHLRSNKIVDQSGLGNSDF